ncbi:MAG: ArsR/SmtB family transcription factor [Acidiferrobacterales bacterium]
MVEYNHTQNQKLDQIFHALADTTRRRILDQLKKHPRRVTDLARHHDMSLNAVSKHLKVLEKADLIKRRVQGRTHLCSFNGPRLKEVEKWMGHYREFWEKRLDALDDFVVSRSKISRKKLRRTK